MSIQRMSVVKDSYLVYLTGVPHHEDESMFGWRYYAVVQGFTTKEIVRNWLKAVEVNYGVDLSEKLVCHNGMWFCGYPVSISKLPNMIVGTPKELNIQANSDEPKR